MDLSSIPMIDLLILQTTKPCHLMLRKGGKIRFFDVFETENLDQNAIETSRVDDAISQLVGEASVCFFSKIQLKLITVSLQYQSFNAKNPLTLSERTEINDTYRLHKHLNHLEACVTQTYRILHSNQGFKHHTDKYKEMAEHKAPIKMPCEYRSQTPKPEQEQRIRKGSKRFLLDEILLKINNMFRFEKQGCLPIHTTFQTEQIQNPNLILQ